MSGKAPKPSKPSKHGKSFINIPKPAKGDSGGDAEVGAPAARATKGMKPGVGSRDKQSAAKQVTRKINPQGSAIESWCLGKRSSYK
jgi:hypothetical protein